MHFHSGRLPNKCGKRKERKIRSFSFVAFHKQPNQIFNIFFVSLLKIPLLKWFWWLLIWWQALKVNLIMTDYSMPGMTGYELLKKIKVCIYFALLLRLQFSVCRDLKFAGNRRKRTGSFLVFMFLNIGKVPRSHKLFFSLLLIPAFSQQTDHSF